MELTLDADTPLKYADMLAQIDWQFMAEENVAPAGEPSKAPTGVPTEKLVKTGDTGTLVPYLVFMALSGMAVTALLVFEVYGRRKRRKQRTASSEQER